MSKSSKFSFSSTFNWQDANLKSLLRNIEFSVMKYNDGIEPFNHYHHKNLHIKEAPFRKQYFRFELEQMINIKYIVIDNYTHGSQMTISISVKEEQQMTQVYKDHYVCKGKTLKKQKKWIDIGALPCRFIEISVQKGCKLSSKSLSMVGIPSHEIGQQLGEDYYKLLVANPLQILYP